MNRRERNGLDHYLTTEPSWRTEEELDREEIEATEAEQAEERAAELAHEQAEREFIPGGFRIIVSTPGCLPEQEPYDVEDLQGAKDALEDELQQTADVDHVGTEEEFDACRVSAGDWNGEGSIALTYGGYVHEARPISQPGSDIDPTGNDNNGKDHDE